MSEPAIRVENLGKVYRRVPRGGVPGESLATHWMSRLREERGATQARWALRGVSFQVMPGEAVGILGHNGAGKSTLMKILARVTRPSTGRFELRGRLAALLELQAGFHPDWTGAQNVFAKGATLGASRSDIRRRFDEIVAFAELEEAIRLPVRQYSTGMRTRLALATVLHLESDILIVDEALTGGDHHFQQRCRGKLADIRDRGTTLLLVSHRTSTIAACCGRGITLDGGELVVDGTVEEALDAYHLRQPAGGRRGKAAREPVPRPAPATGPSSPAVVIHAVRVCAGDGRTIAVSRPGSPVGVEVAYEILEAGLEVACALSFENEAGSAAFAVVEADSEWRGRVRAAGRYRSVAWIPPHLLAPGRLRAGARLRSAGAAGERWTNVVHPADGPGLEILEPLDGDPAPLPGVVRVPVPWNTLYQPRGDAAGDRAAMTPPETS